MPVSPARIHRSRHARCTRAPHGMNSSHASVQTMQSLSSTSPNSVAGGNLRIGAGGEEAGAGEQEPEGGGIAGNGGSTAQRCCSSIFTISFLTWCCAARTRASTFRGEASSWMIGRPAGRCSPILLRTRCSHLRRAASARLATVRGLPALGLAPRFTGSIATVVTTHHSAECDKAECDNAECDNSRAKFLRSDFNGPRVHNR